MTSPALLSMTINRQSPTPIYKQIQNSIEHLILQKRVMPSERLPSSRELASLLKVSRTSSLKAIENLIAEGILVSLPKRGVFVSDNLPKLGNTHSVIRASSTPTKEPLRLFDSGADTHAFASARWAKSMKQAWLKPDPNVLQGTYTHGLPELKTQIAHYLLQVRGLNCQPEQIIITAGNRDALTILNHALVKQQDAHVWLESPCYEQIPNVFNWLGHKVKPLKLDSEGACTPTVTHKNNVCLLTPCRQYPTGVQMSSSRRQQWLNFFQSQQQQGKQAWLIEDDYDNEFVYQGRTPSPFMQQDTTGSTFFIGSFSKVMFRGLRLGFIVSPTEQAAKLALSQKALGVATTLTTQPPLAHFMQSGAFATHLRKMRRLYLEKRDYFCQLLTQLSPWLAWQVPTGGMHVCTYFHNQTTGYQRLFEQLVAARNIKFNSLESHYWQGDKQNGLVLGFTQTSHEELAKHIDLLHKIFTKMDEKLM